MPAIKPCDIEAAAYLLETFHSLETAKQAMATCEAKRPGATTTATVWINPEYDSRDEGHVPERKFILPDGKVLHDLFAVGMQDIITRLDRMGVDTSSLVIEKQTSAKSKKQACINTKNTG